MKSEQTKTQNKPKAWLHFIAIVLTVVTIVSLAVGLFAWSRYTTTQSGNATASVAKWNFNLSLKSGTTSVSGNSSLDLATTQYAASTHVAEGRIAPGTSGQFDIEIDTSGTEVSMVYDVTIAMTNCPRNITFSKKGPGENSFTVISAGGAENNANGTRTISFSRYLRAKDDNQQNENGVKTETIKWEWPYELTGNDPTTNQPYTDAEKNAYDQRDYEDNGKTATLTITATGTEVMNAPISEATITYGNNTAIANGGTITLKLGDEATETTTLSLSSGLESVTFSSSDSTVAEVNSNGKVTAKKAGSAVITITGNETGKTFTVNITVKPKIELQVGDTIRYTPSTVNTYSWDQTLATSSAAADATPLELKSGAGQTYNISEWYVLSIDGDNITMVPKTPSAGVTLQGAQGYNNAVKLLNDACSTLYSDSSKGITARSINIEDIEGVINTYGDASKLSTAKESYGYDTQKYAEYTSYKQYPEIYASENKSVIDGNQNNNGIGLSEQIKNAQDLTQFISRTLANNNDGSITSATSIRPYQTYYYLSNSDFVTALGGNNSIYRKVLLNNSTPNYWVASRCVSLNSSGCGFGVCSVCSGDLSAYNMFSSYGYSFGDARGLFPVVSLSSDVLTTTGTNGVYQVE